MANPTTNLNITLPEPGSTASRGTWGTTINDAIQSLDTAIVAKTGGTFTGVVTMASPVINTGVSGTAILDSDVMSGANATTLATSESIKAYVDSQVTASDLDFQGDSGGALSIDLDSETLDIAGGTGIDTTGSGNEISVAIDSTVATLTGSQTLTNKTLTAPALGTPASGVATNLTGTASGLTAGSVTTNANLTGHITSTGNAAILGSFTVAQLSTALSDATISGNNSGDQTNITGNSATVTTNANLTGDVTSSGNATTIAAATVNESKMNISNTPTNGYVLTARSGNTGGMTWEDLGTNFDTSGTGVAMSIALG